MSSGPAWSKKLRDEIGKAVIGQDAVVERLLVALLAGGHVLLEGMPGLAKTLLVKSLGSALGVQFERIQFTPDLLPSDVVGTMVFQPKTGEFSPHRGPIFANLVLADEINRAPAKVQSALLEAMQERQVTIGGQTHPLPQPVLRHGHPESDRAGGDLSASRGADRPLPLQAARRPIRAHPTRLR
jgi:MoxR-like ATPase